MAIKVAIIFFVVFKNWLFCTKVAIFIDSLKIWLTIKATFYIIDIACTQKG